MEIDGKLSRYKVKWRKAYMIKAEATVYERTALFGFNYWKKVWSSTDVKSERWARRMLPDDMHDWFSRAVHEYEEYKMAWDRYR